MAKYAFPRDPDFKCGTCNIGFCEDEVYVIGLEQKGPGGSRVGCPSCKEGWNVFRILRIFVSE